METHLEKSWIRQIAGADEVKVRIEIYEKEIEHEIQLFQVSM